MEQNTEKIKAFIEKFCENLEYGHHQHKVKAERVYSELESLWTSYVNSKERRHPEIRFAYSELYQCYARRHNLQIEPKGKEKILESIEVNERSKVLDMSKKYMKIWKQKPKRNVLPVINKLKIDNQDDYDFLSRSEWRIQHIIGDGNCGYRSFAQGRKNGRLDERTEYNKAMEYREMTSKWLKTYQDRPIDEFGGMSIKEIIMMDDITKERYGTFDGYLGGVRSNKYASQYDLMALSHWFKQPVFIYQDDPNGKGYKRSLHFGKSYNENPICIHWREGMTEASNHFSVLLPNKGNDR